MDSQHDLQVFRMNHREKLTESLESMFEKESMCDVTICCEGHEVKAHRVILAACSIYFKQIFSTTPFGQYPIVFLKSFSIEDVNSILQFVYTGEVTVPPSQIKSLVESAEALGVTGLGKIDLQQHEFLSKITVTNNSLPSVAADESSLSAPDLDMIEDNALPSVDSSPVKVEANQSDNCSSLKTVQGPPKKRGRKRKNNGETILIPKDTILPVSTSQSVVPSNNSSVQKQNSSLSKPVADCTTKSSSRQMHTQFSGEGPQKVTPPSLSVIQQKINQATDAENESSLMNSAILTPGHASSLSEHNKSTPSTSTFAIQIAPSPRDQLISNGQISTFISSLQKTIKKEETNQTLGDSIGIKMEAPSRGRPRKSLMANVSITPPIINKSLFQHARSSLALKMAAGAASNDASKSSTQIGTSSSIPPKPQ